MTPRRKNEEAMLPIMQAMQCFTCWYHHSLSSKLETRRQERKQGDPEQGDPPFGMKPGRKLHRVRKESIYITVLRTPSIRTQSEQCRPGPTGFTR